MLRLIFIFSTVSLFCTMSYGQFGNSKFKNPTALSLDSIKVQRIITKCDNATNIYKVTKTLSDSCTNDLEKVYGIYTYIASTYIYDLARAKQISHNEIKRELYLSELIKRKKGVCGDFSSLFKLMADTLHIPCFRIDGYSISGKLFHPVKQKKINHAWNLIKIENKWYPVDVTWGIKQYSNKSLNQPYVQYSFLLQNAKWFSLLHLPVDPDFQLYTNKISFKDFRFGKWFRKDSLRDSINITTTLDNRYQLSYLQHVLKTSENATQNAPKVKLMSLHAVVVPLSKVIDKKTKYRQKIAEEDIELAKQLYLGIIAINQKLKGKGYKKAIRYCNAKLAETNKLERKLFPKHFE